MPESRGAMWIYSVFAQAGEDGGSSGDIWGELLRYGLPGLVIVAILTGLLWAKPAVERIIRDKEAAEAQRDKMLATYEDKIIPALVDSTASTNSLKPLLEEVIRTNREVRDEMARHQHGR